MKKVIRGTSQMEQPEITVGLDLGDRFSHYCMLNGDGDAIETGRIQTWELRATIPLRCASVSSMVEANIWGSG
jgi:hypothetical protein